MSVGVGGVQRNSGPAGTGGRCCVRPLSCSWSGCRPQNYLPRGWWVAGSWGDRDSKHCWSHRREIPWTPWSVLSAPPNPPEGELMAALGLLLPSTTVHAACLPAAEMSASAQAQMPKGHPGVWESEPRTAQAEPPENGAGPAAQRLSAGPLSGGPMLHGDEEPLCGFPRQLCADHASQAGPPSQGRPQELRPLSAVGAVPLGLRPLL